MEVTWLLGALLLKLLEAYVDFDNLRPGGPLGGKWMTVDQESRGVRCGKPTPPRL
jgi:hypothetical protein